MQCLNSEAVADGPDLDTMAEESVVTMKAVGATWRQRMVKAVKDGVPSGVAGAAAARRWPRAERMLEKLK